MQMTSSTRTASRERALLLAQWVAAAIRVPMTTWTSSTHWGQSSEHWQRFATNTNAQKTQSVKCRV